MRWRKRIFKEVEPVTNPERVTHIVPQGIPAEIPVSEPVSVPVQEPQRKEKNVPDVKKFSLG